MVTSSPTRHVNADKTHKLIRRYAVTDAAVHDSRVLETLLDEANTRKDVFGDSAYRSAAAEENARADQDRLAKSRLQYSPANLATLERGGTWRADWPPPEGRSPPAACENCEGRSRHAPDQSSAEKKLSSQLHHSPSQNRIDRAPLQRFDLAIRRGSSCPPEAFAAAGKSKRQEWLTDREHSGRTPVRSGPRTREKST